MKWPMVEVVEGGAGDKNAKQAHEKTTGDADHSTVRFTPQPYRYAAVNPGARSCLERRCHALWPGDRPYRPGLFFFTGEETDIV